MKKQHLQHGLRLLVWICCFQACRLVPQRGAANDECLVQSLDFEYLKVSATATYEDHVHRYSSVYINFRIKKDSLIWFSVSGPWGIEILRGTVTPTGITLLNRMQKVYYVYDYATLRALWPGPWDYALLQTLLLGELTGALHEIVQKNAQQVVIQHQKEAWTLTYFINPVFRKIKKLVATARQGSFVTTYSPSDPYRGGLLFRCATLHWYCRTASAQPAITMTLKGMKVQWPSKPLRFPCSIPAQYEKK